jgi:hypothetical protein
LKRFGTVYNSQEEADMEAERMSEECDVYFCSWPIEI